MTKLDPVELDDLLTVPVQHRRLIARWLAERGWSTGQGATTQWIVPRVAAEFGAQCLSGAAADLLCPGDELGVTAANYVLGQLMAGEPVGTEADPQPELTVLQQTVLDALSSDQRGSTPGAVQRWINTHRRNPPVAHVDDDGDVSHTLVVNVLDQLVGLRLVAERSGFYAPVERTVTVQPT